MKYVFLTVFILFGLFLVAVVGSVMLAPNRECPNCGGDMQIRYNGEYLCDDCHEWEEG